MTREGLIQLLVDGNITVDDINEAYNNFESRTCESCKLFVEVDMSMSLCGGLTPFRLLNTKYVSHIDFGCNKWESK